MDIKNYIQLLKSRINKKQLLLTFLLLFLFLAFKPLWEELYSRFIISNIFSHFNPSILIEITFYFLLICFLANLIIKLKLNYQLSFHSFIISLIASLIYIYYRGDEQYLFYTFQSIPILYYSDFILLPIIFLIVIGLNNIVQVSSDKKSQKGFLTDSALKEVGEDLYKREGYAKKLAEKINNTYSSEALAVGINGEWGVGKTSFIDLLKRNINKESFILVDFNLILPPYSRQVEKQLYL